MKTKIKCLLFILLLCALALIGCSKKEEQQQKTTGIDRLEIYAAGQNAAHIYHIKYPFYYYAFEEREITLIDLYDATPVEELSAEKAQWLIQYIESLPESELGDTTKLSYQMYLSYYDDNGEEKSVFKRGYESFPEGWNEFVKHFNEVCGENVLTDNEEVQQVTPEFLTQLFGVTDEDVPNGDLQKLIEGHELDITKLTSINTIDSFIDAYYASLFDDQLTPFRPKDLLNEECTDEEYEAFIQAYLEQIDYNPDMEVESDQGNFRLFLNPQTGTSFYTAKTEDIDKLPAEYDNLDEEYVMYMDAHMEDMTFISHFLYSQDGKYLITVDSIGTDEQIAFVSLNNDNRKTHTSDDEQETGAFSQMRIHKDGYLLEIQTMESGHPTPDADFSTSMEWADTDETEIYLNLNYNLIANAEETKIEELKKCDSIIINKKTLYYEVYLREAVLLNYIVDNHTYLKIAVIPIARFENATGDEIDMEIDWEKLLISDALKQEINFEVTCES